MTSMHRVPVWPDWPEQYLTASRPPGTDEPTEGDLLLRVSSLGTLNLCPARLNAKTLTNEKMFFGTVQHEILARHTVDPDWLPTVEAVVRLADELLAAERPGEQLADLLGGDYGAWIMEQQSMYTAWARWRKAQEFKVLWAEQQLIAPITDRVWLAGTPDGIAHDPVGGCYLGIDYKTSSRDWRASKAQGTQQDDAYAYLAQEVYGLPVTDWLFLVGDRSKGQWVEHHTRTTSQSLDAVEVAAIAAAEYLESGLPLLYTPLDGFGGRGWWCSPDYCDAWNRCPGRFLGDEKDRAIRPERPW